jgi:pimeloyl-ACP methyl ester carboxylesterase
VVGRWRRRLPGTAFARRGVAGLLLLVVALLQLAPVGRGVAVTDGQAGPDLALPVRTYLPEGLAPGSAPGVVVVHGFAGSALLMHSWSLALAHAGFVVVAPDLPGHGANTSRLGERPDVMSAATDLALGHLLLIPEVDGARVGLLGHSMGSRAVLELGVRRAGAVRAVVAVSPTVADVDTTAPRDLLLLAGENEARFIASAEALLERAGGERGLPGDGDARSLRIVPYVEHVSILFSRAAHDASIAWLAESLEHVPTGRAPTGPLAGWALLVLSIILLWQAFVGQAASPAAASHARRGHWITLPVGGIAATASLVIVARSVDVPGLVGILLAGELGLWFFMVGSVWLRFGVGPARPELRDLGWGSLATGVAVLIGASAALAWLPWWAVGVRTGTAAILSIALLPFCLAFAAVLQGRGGLRAVGAWAATAASVVVTLAVAAAVVPGLAFLLLVLPLLPATLGLMTALAVGLDRPWASGLAGAVLIGWLLAVVFPLA